MMKNSMNSPPHEMGKMWVEVCIVSARGLRRPSLWKLQWFAVAWLDPNNKYCTRIDSSGNPNPVWKTKFNAVVDDDSDCTLHVEVYSRDSVFLIEKHHGSAEVSLKEFLARHHGKKTVHDAEDVGSFQLRKKGSHHKPKGFVDVSIRTSLDKEGTGSCARDDEGYQLPGNSNVISLTAQPGPIQAYPTPQGLQQLPYTHPPNPAPGNYTYTHPSPYPSNYTNPSLGGPSYPPASGPTAYQPPRTPPPPPPPPPSHVGYVPTFIPRVNNASSSYLNLPPSTGGGSVRPGGVVAPGFALGMGAGALAAGAVIFGDDFMSGFELPSGLHHPSLGLSIDPPF